MDLHSMGLATIRAYFWTNLICLQILSACFSNVSHLYAHIGPQIHGRLLAVQPAFGVNLYSTLQFARFLNKVDENGAFGGQHIVLNKNLRAF